MVVEVVLRRRRRLRLPGEGGDVEGHARQALLIDGDGACFHRDATDTGFEHLAQDALQGDGFGGGVSGGDDAVGVAVADGADDAGRDARGAKHGFDEVGGGGFAVGSGDGDELHCARGKLVEALGHERHCDARVVDFVDGGVAGVGAFGYGFDDDGGGTTGDGVGDVFVAVVALAATCDEDAAGLAATRVELHVEQVRIDRSADVCRGDSL